MRAWHLVMTRPRQEQVALEQLQRQGFDAWLPMVREPNAKLPARRAPLFPRYLFVNVDSQVENTSPIRSTIGCCGLVRFGAEAATLPEPAAVAIRRRCDEHDCVQPDDRLAEGTPVKVLEGPFAGFEAVFSARTSAERVLVLLNWLGVSRTVQLPAASVSRVN